MDADWRRNWHRLTISDISVRPPISAISTFKRDRPIWNRCHTVAHPCSRLHSRESTRTVNVRLGIRIPQIVLAPLRERESSRSGSSSASHPRWVPKFRDLRIRYRPVIPPLLPLTSQPLGAARRSSHLGATWSQKILALSRRDESTRTRDLRAR